MTETRSGLNIETMVEAVGHKFVIVDGDWVAKEDYRPGSNLEASADAFKHWALGNGDLNPLFLDDDYAAKSARGRLVPPPTWLSTVVRPAHSPQSTRSAALQKRARPANYLAFHAGVE